VNTRGPRDPYVLDQRQLRRSFDRASPDYDRAAVLQARVREQLLERLAFAKLDPALVIDAGSGTGHGSRELKRRFRDADVVALDIAPGMLREASHQQGWWRRFVRVCADAQRLPFTDSSAGLVFSNLMLQWCGDLDAVFAEFRRVLQPHGLLTFTTFGPDTLQELRAAWAAADARTHVHRFIDMHDIGDALVRAGLAEPVLDVEHFTLTYDDVRSLMRDLKGIGAHNVSAGRPAGLMGRGRLEAMTGAYEQFRREGKLPATYEVIFGQAWGRAPAPGAARKTPGGVAHVPVSSIQRRDRK
jgi:malonyl-CoA O-methyltransferase